MKFQFPSSPQVDRRQLMIGGGALAAIVLAALAYFLYFRPAEEPAVAEGPTPAQLTARRDSIIAARTAATQAAVAQAGNAKDSAGAAGKAAKGAALKGGPVTKAARDSAAKVAAAPAAPAAKDSAATVGAKPAVKDSSAGVVVMRESFEFEAGGRRDPFVSLMASEDLRPAVTDLRVAGILWHPTRPVAVLRELTGGAQYRVTVGSALGRMRVTQIRPKAVIFTIEEFGFNRRDSLILGDTTQVRAR